MAAKERELLKAQALRDTKTANELNAQLSEDERENYFTMTLALFAGAVGHRLGDQPSREQIDVFVNEMRHDYRDADPKLNFLAIEALIRALYGEEHLIDDLPAEEQYRAQLPTVVKIVHQSPDMKGRLEDYLNDAENLAAQWQAED